MPTSASVLNTDWLPTRFAIIAQAVWAYIGRLAQLEPGTRVAIVTYNSCAQCRAGFVPVERADELQLDFEQPHIEGDTCLCSALDCAHSLVRDARLPCQVVLVADSKDAWGHDPYPTSDALVECAMLDCIAVGSNPQDVDEHALREIASTRPDGSKRYRWVDRPHEFIRCFQGLAGPA